MAIPSSGAIAFTAIQTEFGGSNPIILTEYYGADAATTANIPANGTIKCSDFYGTSAGLAANVATRSVDRYEFLSGANAWARWTTAGSWNGYSATTYTWMQSGSSSNYDIRITKTGGSYVVSGVTNNVWTRMSTQINTRLNALLGQYKTSTGNVQIKYNANSTIIDYNTCYWSAESENTGCPKCCFTPNTPITMADGFTKCIVDVKVGDEIRTQDGNKEVTEVTVVENVMVYRIMFDDELELNATDDHPLFVIDKGWASVAPKCEYKDIGIPKTLEVGDRVLTESGDVRTITSMQAIYYPFKVYTFAQTKFYANGLLVY